MAFGAAHGLDVLGREGLEVAGEVGRTHDLVERGQQPVGRARHRLVDGAEDGRAAYLLVDAVEASAGRRHAEDPGDHQHRRHAQGCPAEGVDHPHRPPPDTAPEPLPGEGTDPLADEGEREHDDHGGDGDREALGEPVEQSRRELDSREPACNQPHGGEGTDEETLLVAREGVAQGAYHEDDVEGVHAAPPLRDETPDASSASPFRPCRGGVGSSM